MRVRDEESWGEGADSRNLLRTACKARGKTTGLQYGSWRGKTGLSREEPSVRRLSSQALWARERELHEEDGVALLGRDLRWLEGDWSERDIRRGLRLEMGHKAMDVRPPSLPTSTMMVFGPTSEVALKDALARALNLSKVIDPSLGGLMAEVMPWTQCPVRYREEEKRSGRGEPE